MLPNANATKGNAAISAWPTKSGKQVIKSIVRCRYLYLLFALPFLYYIIFKYLPMVGIIIAFKNYSPGLGFFKSPWVGFSNFYQFLTDPYFWQVFKNTLVLNVNSLVWSFPAPILLAMLLNEVRARRFKKLAQTVGNLPHFLSTVVTCGLVVSFLSYKGIVNQFVTLFNIEPRVWLMEAKFFRTIYIGSGIWQNMGWGSIIYLAALAGIDLSLYEAAVVDGANRWQKFRYVSFPGILPTVAIMFIMDVGRIMSVAFEKILLLYTGSTMEVADVISTYVYRRGILGADFGYGTAIGLFESVVGIIFLYSADRFSKRTAGSGLF